MIDEAIERAEKKVSAPASRVDERRVVEPEARNGPLEGAVEDVRLDEVRRLEQGEALLRLFVEALVKVPEKARVRLPEAKRRRLRVRRAEQIEQRPRTVDRRTELPHGVVRRVEEVLRCGEVRELLEDRQEVVAVGEVRGDSAELLLAVGRSGSGDAVSLEKAAVFERAGEDEREHPGRGHLDDDAAAPHFPGVTRPLRLAFYVPLRLQRLGHARRLVGAREQIIAEDGQHALGGRKERRRVEGSARVGLRGRSWLGLLLRGHGTQAAGAAALWRFSIQSRDRRRGGDDLHKARVMAENGTARGHEGQRRSGEGRATPTSIRVNATSHYDNRNH